MTTVKANKKGSTSKPRHKVAASPKRRGLNAIDVNVSNKLIDEGGLFLLKTGVLIGIGYFIYYKFVNRFQSLSQNSSYPAANISDGEAETRANAIFGSMSTFGNSVTNVADNLQGLNYNAFVKVYNAFGKRPGYVTSGDLNLVEWLNDQFDETQMNALRFLVPGLF